MVIYVQLHVFCKKQTKESISFWETWLKERDGNELMNANIGLWNNEGFFITLFGFCQVGKLLMENAQLALQSDTMRARAATIQARSVRLTPNSLSSLVNIRSDAASC